MTISNRIKDIHTWKICSNLLHSDAICMYMGCMNACDDRYA